MRNNEEVAYGKQGVATEKQAVEVAKGAIDFFNS
jgi:hypothetical protein